MSTLQKIDYTISPRTPGRLSLVPLAVMGGISGLCVVALFFVPLDRQTTGIVVMVGMLCMMLSGIPIAYSMLLMSFIGVWKFGGFAAVKGALASNIYATTASWSMSVIPMFVFMGIVLWRSGLTGKAYAAARQWLGGMPGGLAVGTNFAGAGLAAASGSTVGITFALGRVSIPEMMRAGYSPRLATASVAMAGTLGQLIPPSIMLIIYAGIASVPVGPLLLASIVPGLLMAVMFGILIVAMVVREPELAPGADMSGVTWRTRFKSLAGMIPLSVIVVVIVAGLFRGWFTPTEAGAVGAVLAVVAGIVSSPDRSLKRVVSFVSKSAMETARTTAIIFLVLINVDLLNRVLALSGVNQAVAEWIISVDMSRVTLLLVLLVVYLIMGMFLDPLAIMMLTVPALSVGLVATGVDMTWFGVYLIILCEVAIVTPPVGMLCFIVHRLAQRRDVGLGVPISLVDVFKGVLPFIATALLLVVILILFPDIALWLPSMAATGAP